jgi:ribosomal-protein-alanine N-acetyltransferase
MAEMTLRRMRKEDLDGVMAIETASFQTPWSRQSMENEAENPAAYYVVACMDGVVAAYAGAWIALDEGHITNIAVHPDFRRRGCGEAVTRALLAYLKSVDVRVALLEVRVSNAPARALYKKLGFAVLSVRKKYYEDTGEDAYVMLCVL